MGTRIHVFLTHDLPRFDDINAALQRLAVTLPAAFAVRDYWRSIDPPAWDPQTWESERVSPRLPLLRRYSGPGSLHLTVTPAAARISTGARWRGFLSIEHLRGIHLPAFRAIACALHSPTMAICADSNDDVNDVFIANGNQDDCIAKLHSTLGPRQPSVEAIAPEIVAQTARGVPGVWYLEPTSRETSQPRSGERM